MFGYSRFACGLKLARSIVATVKSGVGIPDSSPESTVKAIQHIVDGPTRADLEMLSRSQNKVWRF